MAQHRGTAERHDAPGRRPGRNPRRHRRQSDVIRIRSNKAYDHIKELLKEGLVEAKKDGSTWKLSPTKKFYDYFDLSEDEEIIQEH